jgi:uncharacterized protein DUF547
VTKGPDPRVRLLRPGAVWALVTLSMAGCTAPRAVLLEGDAAQAIRKGIESGVAVMDHSRFDAVVRQHAWETGSRFDYEGLKKDPGDFNLYLEEIGKADLSGLSRDELLALLVNAYNAFVIQSVLDSMTPRLPEGVKSIRDIPQVFERPTHLVGGYRLSLNNIEHNLLRPLFMEPRIHFVVNCASISCPPLLQEALTGGKLESLLEYAARRTLSSPDYVRLEGGRLRVTKLLEWYGSDFVDPRFRGAEKSLPRYLRKYASDEVGRWLDSAGENPPVSFMDYDWRLNRPARIRLQDSN